MSKINNVTLSIPRRIKSGTLAKAYNADSCLLLWEERENVIAEMWASRRPLNTSFLRLNPYSFYHRLSLEVPDLQRSRSYARHDPKKEFEVAVVTQGFFGRLTNSNPEAFADYLKYVHSLISAGDAVSSFRRGRSFCGSLRSDDDSSKIEYIAPNFIENALRNMMINYNNIRTINNSRIIRAIYLYLAVITIHPFSDANGRVSRITLSNSLSELFGKTIILPESSISAISRYGLLLRKREMQLFEKWDPIIQAVCDAVLNIYKLSRSFSI